MLEEYKHNSKAKDLVRSKWVAYSKKIKSDGLTIITLPSNELNDLILFAKEKLITWETTETGAFKVIEGKVICFEKKASLFIEMSKKLVNTNNFSEEFCSYLANNYRKIKDGKLNIFPADLINLDLDSCLSKNKIKIQDTLQLIFEFQAQYKRNFSFFLTFPETEVDDGDDFKNALTEILNSNLNDENNVEFKRKYELNTKNQIDNYDIFLTVTLSKLVLSQAANHSYKLLEAESILYGSRIKEIGSRKRMISLLFAFEYSSQNSARLYYNQIHMCLDNISDLNHSK